MKASTGSKDSREEARTLLLEMGIHRSPVPVADIAKKLGIALRFTPLDAGLSGMIFRKGVACIVVNSLHHPNRQRFTLGHEIAHFLLHMQDIGGEVHVDKKFLAFARDMKSSEGWDRKEIEANRFAAELLVPRDFLARELRGQVVDLEDDASVSDLADNFQVSRQVMTFRLAEFSQGRPNGR